MKPTDFEYKLLIETVQISDIISETNLTKVFLINGIEVSKEEFNREIKKHTSKNVYNMYKKEIDEIC